MGEFFVGPVEELPLNKVHLVEAFDRLIGVIRLDDGVYAYENYCLHQGGPICLGEVLGKQEAILDDEKRIIAERFSETELHLICPWHGWEYDIRTGECVTDRNLHLRHIEVDIRDGHVFLRREATNE